MTDMLYLIKNEFAGQVETSATNDVIFYDFLAVMIITGIIIIIILKSYNKYEKDEKDFNMSIMYISSFIFTISLVIVCMGSSLNLREPSSKSQESVNTFHSRYQAEESIDGNLLVITDNKGRLTKLTVIKLKDNVILEYDDESINLTNDQYNRLVKVD